MCPEKGSVGQRGQRARLPRQPLTAFRRPLPPREEGPADSPRTLAEGRAGGSSWPVLGAFHPVSLHPPLDAWPARPMQVAECFSLEPQRWSSAAWS